MRYDYRCQQGHVFERRHSIHESPPIVCTACGQPARRIITTAPRVNWGGLPPHLQDEIGPAARDMIDNRERNLDKYLEKKALRNE